MKKKTLFKNILIVTTVLALLLLGIAFYLIWKEQTSNVTDKYDVKYGDISSPAETFTAEPIEVDFKAVSSDLKTSEKVYLVAQDDSSFPDEEFVLNTSNNLGLPELSQGENFILYDNGQNDSLLYKKQAKTFTLKLSDRAKTKNIQDEKEYIQIATSKLQDLDLWPWKDESEYRTRNSYYYTISYNYYETNDKDNASLYSITFQNTIDDIPIIASRINSGAINVMMDLNSNVIEITYNYRSADLEEYATYPILTLEEALEEIRYENYELVTPFESFTPSDVQITDIEFAYRAENTDQQYLQPCYFFEGTDEHGQLVTLIVPAVRDEYLIDK